MADDFRPASKGDPIAPRFTAGWFNGVNRAVNTLRGGEIDLAQQQLASAADTSYVTVSVVNKSGSDIDRPGGVLKIDGLAFTFADKPKQVFDKPVTQGVAPSDADDDFVILTKPLKNGKPGRGVKAGYVFCRLNYTDTAKEHDKASPTSSVNYLESGTTGVPILWRELEGETGAATTGEQWAMVLLGSSSGGDDAATYVLRLTESVPAAATPDTPGELAAEIVSINEIFLLDGDDYIDPGFIGTHVVILNPWPYAAGPGEYPIKFTGREQRDDISSGFIARVFILDGFDVTGHANWSAGTDQALVHYAGQPPQWDAVTIGGGGGGDCCDDLPPWILDPLLDQPFSPVEGYAIDVEAPSTVHFDPTEITGFAAQFQFFHHVAADVDRDDPSWKTVADYDVAKKQMWWHEAGTFKFETVTDYGGSATSPQFLVNWGAGNGGDWQWKDASGYNVAATELLGHVTGTWQWKTVAEWLTNALTIEIERTGTTLKVLLKVGGVEISSDTLTLVEAVVNNPTSIELNLDADSLDSELNYTPKTVTVFADAAGTPATFSDSVIVDECA